ncbi:DUF6789 family protein [Candidatus Nitrospira bockiana]
MRGILSRLFEEETVLSGVVLLAAGISPVIFPAAQAGLAPMPWLATRLLMPSLVLLAGVVIAAMIRGYRRLRNRMLAGALAGMIATVGLDVVRLTGFHLGWMPGDLAMLLGVLLTDRFMEGPSALSNFVGYLYHYWNGAAFGILFAVLVGRKPVIWGIVYALVIAVMFLVSPAVQATGAGFMGLGRPMMPVTIILAHLVFGTILGVLSRKWVQEDGWLFSRAGWRHSYGALSPLSWLDG